MKKKETDQLIYTTSTGWQIYVRPGEKSEQDFIVRYKEPGKGKRKRTPKHLHLIVELYVKQAYKARLTRKLRDHIVAILRQVEPVDYFPPILKYYKPEHIEQFTALDKVGEYPVEFLLVVTELIAIQEKTNYPQDFLLLELFEDLTTKDRYSVVDLARSAALGRRPRM